MASLEIRAIFLGEFLGLRGGDGDHDSGHRGSETAFVDCSGRANGQLGIRAFPVGGLHEGDAQASLPSPRSRLVRLRVIFRRALGIRCMKHRSQGGKEDRQEQASCFHKTTMKNLPTGKAATKMTLVKKTGDWQFRLLRRLP